MKRFSIIILAFVLLVPILAQEDTAAAAFERLVPSNVRLRLNAETGQAELVFNAVPEVCEPLISEVSVEGNVIDVDAYVPLSAQGTTCNFIAPYEPVIGLGELEGDISYVLLLNDFATTFFLPQPEGVLMDMPFSVLWGEDNNLIAFSRVDAIISTVEIVNNDNGQSIHLTGSHPDGCESEAYTWLRQDDLDSGVYHVEVFRLIPEGVMCPASLQDFSLTLETELPNSIYIEAGEQWFAHTNAGNTPLVYTFLTMDSVSVVADGNNYAVSVEATLPECSVEPTSLEDSTDYASFINIMMIRPLDAVCANLENPYEKSFSVELLPVIINGVAYDENGIVAPPDASAAGIRDEASMGGGNVMQVDTVIESVDVLILESFPMQLNLEVKGYQADGCDYPVTVEQSREGNVVTVHIYREVPADVMCTMQIVPYEETIRLEGGFEGGTIEIHVNDFTTSVDL